MQRLEGLMRKAIQDYEMLAPGDRVCVGVSGGKDSVALTVGLGRLRRYLGIPFEVVAVTLDPQFGGQPMDCTPLEELFAREQIPYHIHRTDIGRVGLTCARNPIPARSAPSCAGVRCTPQRWNWAATR